MSTSEKQTEAILDLANSMKSAVKGTEHEALIVSSLDVVLSWCADSNDKTLNDVISAQRVIIKHAALSDTVDTCYKLMHLTRMVNYYTRDRFYYELKLVKDMVKRISK